ncbi:MAG TPA: polysaccharide deacetylase family protein [Solirubrobacterales bacterium]|nr:polysaccharide deacetylase family protein [Solirubrobacterales bacterium]
MPTLPLTRKIPCALAALLLAAAALPAIAPGAHAARRPKIAAATVSQAGQDLVLTVRTARPVAVTKLQPRPDTRRAAAAYLCFAFAPAKGDAKRSTDAGDGASADGSAAAGAAETRLCLGGPKGHKRAGLVTVDAAGKPLTRTSLPATLNRPRPEKLVLSVIAGPTHPTGLRPGGYRWHVFASTGACKLRNDCTAEFPTTGAAAFRLRPVRAVGCTGGDAELVSAASTERQVVALTFDDGPSEYTDRYLDVLREKDVPGTFFEIGQEMPGREATMRRILAEGDEIGDHTMNHVEYPGYGQIAGAAARIKAYTGFQPCLFRPPGGAENASVIDTAGSLGMKTITWDVDPRDWSLPGTSEIYSNIVDNAKPGAIILMHDGGGPRDETLAALPEIIDTLRAKGYGFETVSALLGDKMLYRPFG